MATRDGTGTGDGIERDAEAVLLMAAELVARARRGDATPAAAVAMTQAREALKKPFSEATRQGEQRDLLAVVEAVADTYRSLNADAPSKVVEAALVSAISALGYRLEALPLATLAAFHDEVKTRGGPVETAKAAVGEVGHQLLRERHDRLGLAGSPSITGTRKVNAVGNWKSDLARTPPAPPLPRVVSKTTALELLLGPRAAGTFDDALAELQSPTDFDAERIEAAVLFGAQS